MKCSQKEHLQCLFSRSHSIRAREITISAYSYLLKYSARACYCNEEVVYKPTPNTTTAQFETSQFRPMQTYVPQSRNWRVIS